MGSDRGGDMNTPTLSFCLITYNRKDELRDAIDSILAQDYDDYEIIVISNSTDGTSNLFSDGGQYDRPKINYYHYDGRMGVPQARNIAHEKATGDYLVTIDDDAEFTTDDCASHIESVFEQYDEVGVLAFKVRNAYSKKVESFPGNDKDRMKDTRFETTWYVGCGHAIRASALAKTDGYPSEFEYGSEELDLSYQLLEQGYTIIYEPSIKIIHKESPEGRNGDSYYTQKMIENRIRLSVRHVPWRFAMIYLFIWTGYTLYLSRLDIPAVIRGWISALQDLPSLLRQRTPISDQTVTRLSNLPNRLYY